MSQIKPTQLIISSDAKLAELYNDHAVSALLTSKVSSPEEAQGLLDEGAEFNAVIFVNGEGEFLKDKLASAHQKTLNIDAGYNDTVYQIHKTLESDMLEMNGIG